MPVKYWSFAGLMLTAWCNASCASCYLNCGPDRPEWMGVEAALGFWRSLVAASPHGCRVHLTGGEPFGDWPRLIAICRRARAEGLGPLHKVETNAFWATDAAVVRERVAALDDAGMQKLVISADPYHQQFVPIERPRRAAQVAAGVLGSDRVQVRWRDWLSEGEDTDKLSGSARSERFARYAAGGRDRLCGRAADALGAALSCKSPSDLADNSCQQMLLRSKHVHVGPEGRVFAGTCAGIVLGRLGPERSASDLWGELTADYGDRPVVGTLARAGPVGLMREATGGGFRARTLYASKCHLCWDIRRWFAREGLHGEEVGPRWMYET